MTTHIVEELKDTLTQDFILSHRREIGGVRPKLYFNNDPSGTFTISLKEGATTLASTSLTMTEILSESGWTASQYHYGFLRFQFESPVVLQRDVTYTVELSQAGYTYSGASYLGWIKEFDNPINQDDGTEIDDDFNRPLSYQLWSYI